SQAINNPFIRDFLEPGQDSSTVAQELLAHIYKRHVNRDSLFAKAGGQQEAFLGVLRRYVAELADILVHAVACDKQPDEILEEMFGDKRRRVDVTFDVGPAGEAVHVTGKLDYVFYDWRTTHNRIVDYKLTPADKPANDLFQVCLYAL